MFRTDIGGRPGGELLIEHVSIFTHRRALESVTVRETNHPAIGHVWDLVTVRVRGLGLRQIGRWW